MTPRKPQPKKEPLRIRSHTLTPSTEAILKRLSQTATDVIGRGVSSSAVVRALALYAGQQSPIWLQDVLFPLIEQELSSGILWGKRKS